MGLRRQDLRLGSCIRRLGTAIGLNAGGWTPANLGAALLSWREYTLATTFADTSGTRITNGTNIAANIDQRDTLGRQSYPVAGFSFGNDRPTWSAANKAAVQDGGSALQLYTSVALSTPTIINLTAPFTLYAVGLMEGSSNWVPAGYSGGGGFWIDSGGNANVYDSSEDDISIGVSVSSGLIVARWRMDASENMWFAASGQTELFMGNPNMFQVDAEGFVGLGVNTDNGNDHRAWLIVNGDTVAKGMDANIRAYLKTRFGVSL
jgi:hypothetical protein